MGKRFKQLDSELQKVSLSIHTGVLYVKKDTSLQTVLFATVSNNPEHQAHAVWGHLKSALQKILSTRPHVKAFTCFQTDPHPSIEAALIFTCGL
ncbi:unnamed protein product [Acanthoscelides obtectus]|uniref:Uncharacterized protein n=1 Tax=Acanthoscelides obtectus TaxID=200917 RepID=A0A9P0LZ38_ACAOB|nr:unnamed protein product [Acanthoscelides obtectus]CAK1621648.1 hypothetical protein AOBTE_LOCUS1063 [Acanthoscelides obtectus]